MHNITLSYCNNIKNGNISIESNKLNIKYGINGTGKTSLSKAIFYSNSEDLKRLKSFYSEELPTIKIDPTFKKILIFNEDFVNQFVFLEDDVMKNSFEVFITTQDYGEKKKELDDRLQNIHQIIESNADIFELKRVLESVLEKFSITNGRIKKAGVYKSILSKQNLYNVPPELFSYKDFIENTNINISWIDWKNKGDVFDISDGCPYCTEKINRSEHNKRKEVFQRTYKKTDSQNLKNILDLFSELELYLKEEKYNNLITYIKKDTDEDVIESILTKLISEIEIITVRLINIDSFWKKKRILADIGKLNEQVSEMKLPELELFDFFGGKKVEEIINTINSKVDELLGEIDYLKRDLGYLKGKMNATIKSSQEDINEFLKTAGINYELFVKIDDIDETKSKTILKQCYSSEKTEVINIKNHLSWGEKNAFSLILFMYFAIAEKADLIILDDPISSFDSNKKYAILHRMFKNISKSDISFENKTVLLLTHDFEPITDFLVIGKLDEQRVTASYIWNEKGNLSEKIIDTNNDIKLISESYSELAKDESVNIVSRVAFLRKLSEIKSKKGAWRFSYEILSCLIHGTEIRKKVSNRNFEDIPSEDIESGLNKIKEFIPTFDFDSFKNEIYNVNKLVELYKGETNSYFRMQIFREIIEIIENSKVKLSKMDSAWYKFVDETYHIENDLLHFLDLRKFNIVPSYILEKVDDMIIKLI